MKFVFLVEGASHKMPDPGIRDDWHEVLVTGETSAEAFAKGFTALREKHGYEPQSLRIAASCCVES